MSKSLLYLRLCEKNAIVFVLNVSTDNSIVESLAWIFFSELCLDKSWKLIEIYFFIESIRIEIFNNKTCKVTFGFEYIIII